jgi:hypothetical protein
MPGCLFPKPGCAGVRPLPVTSSRRASSMLMWVRGSQVRSCPLPAGCGPPVSARSGTPGRQRPSTGTRPALGRWRAAPQSDPSGPSVGWVSFPGSGPALPQSPCQAIRFVARAGDSVDWLDFARLPRSRPRRPPQHATQHGIKLDSDGIKMDARPRSTRTRTPSARRVRAGVSPAPYSRRSGVARGRGGP